MSIALIKNIKTLVNTRAESTLLRGAAMADLPCINDAFLHIEDGIISDYGSMNKMPKAYNSLPATTDASGKMLLPCWCDSHTHLVFAASREDEFVDKIKGLSYAEIAARGGGILNSVKMLHETSESELLRMALARIREVISTGTGALEIKSGYGLSVQGELKMLRVIQKIKESVSIPVRATFLGAHTYPLEYRENHAEYIRLLTEEMLPAIAAEKLADYIDVFCEKGFFSPDEADIICRAGRQYGLIPKLHVNQLHSIGGIEAGISNHALSMDHLETLTDHEINLLSGKIPGTSDVKWQGICTLLPTAAFFLRMPLQPARKLIDAGSAVALASDFNPGSSPSGNMNLVVAMSCIQMKMLPEEAINAATLNGAWAMGLQNEAGSITKGKRANLILTRPVPSLAYLPYAFGSNHIDQIMLNGEWI